MASRVIADAAILPMVEGRNFIVLTENVQQRIAYIGSMTAQHSVGEKANLVVYIGHGT